MRWLTLIGLAICSCGGGRTTGNGALVGLGSRDALRVAGKISGPGAGVATGDFAGWAGWTPASPKRFRSLGHGGLMVDIFVAPPHAELYDRGPAAAPVGFRVAKASYDDAGNFLAVTGMQKMPPGYDPEHGDWYYLVVLRDGRTATMQGLLPSCSGCHVRAKQRDYLFGVTSD